MRKDTKIGLAVLALIFSTTGWTADPAKGQEAYNSGDYQTALAEWQPLAEDGYADAQFGLGLMFANGFGVTLNDDQALKWYHLAADQGHAQAQCNIAVMFANGWGVPQSNEEAFKWYSLAAEAGLTEAQFSLAKRYSKGRGIDKDRVAALQWFSIAAELGNTNASFKRDAIAEKLSAAEIAEADRLTGLWMEKNQALLASH